MKYSSIRIFPVSNDWSIEAYPLEYDREPFLSTPNSMGFFYYPETVTKEEAFSQLKEHMIKRHINRINDLQKSLEKLKELSLEN